MWKTVLFAAASFLALSACVADPEQRSGVFDASLGSSSTSSVPKDSDRVQFLGKAGKAEKILVWGADRSVQGVVFGRGKILQGVIPAIMIGGDSPKHGDPNRSLEYATLMAKMVYNRTGRPTIALRRPFGNDKYLWRGDREARLYDSVTQSLQKGLGFRDHILGTHSGAVVIGTERFNKDTSVVCYINAAGALDLDAQQRHHGWRQGSHELNPINRIDRLPTDGRRFIHLQNRNDENSPVRFVQRYADRVPSNVNFTMVVKERGMLGHRPFDHLPGVISDHCGVEDSDTKVPRSN